MDESVASFVEAPGALTIASLVHWGLFGVAMDSEAYLRELMKIDAKKVGKIEDLRPRTFMRRGIGEPWKELGVSRSTYYKNLNLGKTRISYTDPNSIESKAPWKKLGIHRTTYFEWKKRGYDR